MLSVKDYNYEKPSLEIIGRAVIDEQGMGEVYSYGDNVTTEKQANQVAAIRAQAFLCHKHEYVGNSTAPSIRSGFLFDCKNHYRDDFNKEYLAISVSHEGNQTEYLIAGIAKNIEAQEEKMFYKNHFTAIPAKVQFRSSKTTKASKIAGVFYGTIDATGTGDYAELDEYGRYKVKLPFDLSGRKDGKASCWLRMMQPYVGKDHGFHFPIKKNTEVLLSFIDVSSYK